MGDLFFLTEVRNSNPKSKATQSTASTPAEGNQSELDSESVTRKAFSAAIHSI